jgi:hypothetical protein
MRLSEAIALGRVTIDHPRAFDLEGCAFGMALNAVGCPKFYENIHEQWPWVETEFKKNCPVCNRKLSSNLIRRMITHVFDYHVIVEKDWNLEQLIDWVRSIEPEETEVKEQTGDIQVIVQNENSAVRESK